MALITLTQSSGASLLHLRLTIARSQLPMALTEAVRHGGNTVRAALSAAAPVGAGAGTAPAGDASGALSDSFQAQFTAGVTEASSTVRTTQPTKLRYVREGTGIYGPRGAPIRPTRARALFWPGAEHPVRSVRGMPPNDFVTPALAEAVPQVMEALRTAAQDALHATLG